MNAPLRLTLYGLGALAAFGIAYVIADRVVSEDTVERWEARSQENAHGDDHGSADDAADHGAVILGVAMSGGGFHLSPIRAPGSTGEDGRLSFRILGDDTTPLTTFRTSHEKDLHLIVVRSDGAHFRHVHPALDRTTGTWSIPWRWSAAGTYRVYADFVPGGAAEPDSLTLTRTVDVTGTVHPSPPSAPVTHDHIEDLDLTLHGDLVAGSSRDLVVSITRSGRPVTTLEPYLGAFGHLVALRQGDLAYLHVHPTGDTPEPDARSGPTIAFAAQAPTPGRYLLYLDVKIDGRVRTATFVVDAVPARDAPPSAASGGSHDDSHGSHGDAP